MDEEIKYKLTLAVIIFLVLLWYTGFLCNDRFKVTDKTENYTSIKNISSHFLWGFMLPILTVIFAMGLNVFFKINWNWKWGYWLGVIIFILGGGAYYADKIHNTLFSSEDIIKIIIDIVGFILATCVIKSDRTKQRVFTQNLIAKN